MSSTNPEESLSDGTYVDNNENYIPIQWILLCVIFPAYTLLLKICFILKHVQIR